MIVRKAFKYRFSPTDSQARQLAQTFGCARLVWNCRLETPSQAYEQEKKSLSYADTTAALAQLKETPEKAFLNEVSSVVLVETEIQPPPAVEAEVGVDVGVKTLATCGNGVKFEIPRPLRKAANGGALRRGPRATGHRSAKTMEQSGNCSDNARAFRIVLGSCVDG